MPYIHTLPNWPNLTWRAELLADRLASVRHRQGILTGKLQSLGIEIRREASLASLTTEVVTSSAIEGERLPPDEVRSSIARRLGLDAAGLVPSARRVDGVVEMMLDATREYQAPLTAERLLRWHSALFPTGLTGMRPITVGAWRTDALGPMQVVSGPLGNERVHFEAPAAARLPLEMQQFLDWLNAAEPMDPVIKAAVAHFWFVTIHPFDDGNGRIARAIAELALARSDGTPDRFYSMSAQIEAERNDYYRALEFSQRADQDITRWIEWFLGCLGRAFDRAEGTLARVFRDAAIWELANRSGVNERQRRVLTRVLGAWEGQLTTSKYAMIAKCSSDTALRDIQALVEHRILAKNPAGGRSVSYRLADTLPDDTSALRPSAPRPKSRGSPRLRTS
ncbi:MAG: Fic family protein [Gemmatimonadaceae bacterium]